METVRSEEASSFGPTLAPGTIVGGYAVVRRIGSGGVGVVYEARHQQLDKPVAVKTLHGELAADPNVRARFLREGRAAAKLRHPNVVDVCDVALEGDNPYLVMELLEGEELTALIRRESPLDEERTVDLLLPIVSALALAHERGIIHRDLKPQNVFLSRTPSGLVVPKVVDFGISKLLGEHVSDVTKSIALLGTPHYMSPEQASGVAPVDCRSDQFSLGVIAYECLTGARPFVGDSLYTLLDAVVNHNPPPVDALNPDIGANLSAIVTKMMAKAPEGRFGDIRDLGAALLPFASPRVRLAFEQDFPIRSSSRVPIPPSCDTIANTPRWVPKVLRLARGGGPPRRWSRILISGCLAGGAIGALALVIPRGQSAKAPPSMPSSPTTAQVAHSATPATISVPSPTPDSRQPTWSLATSGQFEAPPPAQPARLRAPRRAPSHQSRVANTALPEAAPKSSAPDSATAGEIKKAPERGANGALIIP